MRRVLAIATVLVSPSCAGSPAKAPPSTTAEPTMSTAAEPKPPAGPPRHVECGDFTTCALAEGGEVRCWGRNKGGEIGDGGPTDKPRNVPVTSAGKATHVALASQFGCALLENKTVKCWGTGRIANDGKPYENAQPTDVIGVAAAEELVASGAVACARTPNGVVCWGADPAIIGTPSKGPFTQLAAGFTHACGIEKSGAVACWGSGDWAATGAFAKPPITNAIQLVTGDRHACVLTKDKRVKCWGSNDAGQLGIKPDSESHKKPVEVAGITGALQLFAGEASTCAVLSNASVKCWGANNEGELGLGMRSSDERPSTVLALADVTSMCLGSTHGCAVTKSAKLVCWGGNAHGQVGDGTRERRESPMAVAW